jgi:hypothetical protein
VRAAEQRGWTKVTAPCYVEEHHIFPKGIFGKNGRVVYLTAREHFIAHALLMLIFIKRNGRKHWKTQKMIHAFWGMNNQSNEHHQRYSNSRLYEQARKEFSESITGDGNPFFGKKHTEETREKIKRGLPVGGAFLGKTHTPETIERMRIAQTGHSVSDETKERLRQANLGENNPNYGRPRSEETRRKIAETEKGKIVGEETRQRQSVSGTGNVWWNNGITSTRARECPGEGWVRGRIYKRKS